MNTDISLPDFKRKHGLSYSHIRKMAGCTLDEARAYSKGAPIPEDLARIVKAVDIIVSVAKAERGIFTDIDAQQAIHEIELRDKEIAKLKAQIAAMDKVAMPPLITRPDLLDPTQLPALYPGIPGREDES